MLRTSLVFFVDVNCGNEAYNLSKKKHKTR